MRYETTARDFFYETSGVTALTYYITFNNTPIYWGASAKSPNEPNLRINIGRRISDYLYTSMPDFREFDGVVIAHPEQMGWFNLYDTEGNLLEEFCVVYEFSGDFRWENCSINEPINGHADMRQKIIISRESVSADTFEINSEGEGIEIDFSQNFNFDYSSGTKTIGVTANTVFSAETTSDWITDLNVSLSTNDTGVTGTISFKLSKNEGDIDRVGEIDIVRKDYYGGECTLPDIFLPIKVYQEWNWYGGGSFRFVEDYFYDNDLSDMYSHTVQVYAGIPYFNRRYAFVSIPQSGRTTSVRYATDIPVLDVVTEKNGTVISTEEINPTMVWRIPTSPQAPSFTGASDIYQYTFTENDSDSADEYVITFKAKNGETKGVIYGVQPPSVPSAYEARNIISGSGIFNYYLTLGDRKNYWATGTYYATDAEAIAAGYPRKGGYPTTPVYNLRESAYHFDPGPATIIYVQSTGVGGFDFGGDSAVSGLSAQNLPVIQKQHTWMNPSRDNFKNFNKDAMTFMDIPRCLSINPAVSFNKWIGDINLWSVTYIGANVMYSTSGVKELYIPNIGCIEENNFYEAPDLTDVYLGNTLRFFGIKDVSTSQGGGSNKLPQHISFHYLGTKQMFQDKVIYKPKGTYHCTDGDLVIS